MPRSAPHPAIEAVIAVVRVLDETHLQQLVSALENDRLKLTTTVRRVQLDLHCSTGAARLIFTMFRRWSAWGRTEQGLADMLQGIWLTRAMVREEIPAVSLVWTGPVSLPHLTRTTGGVLLDLIDRAREEIVIVDYTLSEQSRYARRIVERLVRARRRDVQIVLIGDRVEEKQLEVLKHWWPGDLDLPLLYTRRETEDDPKAALHAKAMVVDSNVMLATSANLSYHGLEGNIELGLLVEGKVAREAREVLMALIEEGVCVRVE